MSGLVSAREIAAALGCGVRAVQLKSDRQGWLFEDEAGHGSPKKLYIVEALPAEVQAALASAAPEGVKAAVEGEISGENCRAERERGLARLAGALSGSQDRADARAAIVEAWRRWATGQEAFAAAYNADGVDVEAWVRVEVPVLTPRSLRNWDRTLAKRGIGRLAGNYGNRKGAGRIEGEPEIKDLILGMIVDHPHASARLVMRALRAKFEPGRVPGYRTVQRYIATWKQANRQLHAAVTNPDKWRSHFQAAGGDAGAGIERLNQLWELDSTPGDVMLADGSRHAVIGAIDVYSRRFKLLVSRTSRATAIAALTRRCLLDFGVPETARTDEGSDYTSRHMTRVFAGLGIVHDRCPPFTPERKPFIERALGTFAHDIVELLPGFIGHDVAGRQDIRARKSFADRLMKRGMEPAELRLTPEAFQQFCDTWTDAIYALDPHRGLGGLSPFERAAAFTGPVTRIMDERALDVLLAEAPGGDGWRTIGKKGIRIEGADYDAPDLGGHEGEKVRVLLDEHDVGAIYVFAAEGGFLCKAMAPEIAGVPRREVAIRRKAKQKATMAEGKKALKAAASRAKTKDIAAEILRDAEVRAGTLVAFPRPTIEHETPALEAAAQAISGPVEIAALTPEQQAAADAKWAELTEDDEDKVVRLEARHATGGERPHFADDREFALWLLQHPDDSNAEEKAWLDERLTSNSFRLWIGITRENSEEVRRKARR